MGILSKITDPLGITKKAKKKLAKKIGFDYEDPFGWEKKVEDKLKDAIGYDFEKWKFKDIWEQIKDDPERLLFPTADPLSAKIHSKLLNQDWDPLVNQLGGPTSQQYQDYIEQGGDPRAAKNAATAHQVAAAIASWYAGGALGALAPGAGAVGAGAGAGAGAAGAGAGAAGATAGGLTLSAAQAAALARAGIAAGASYADEEWAAPDPIEAEARPWDPRMMSLMGLGRTFGYGAQNPYGINPYGGAKGGEVMKYAEGGRVRVEGPGAAKRGKEMVEQIAEVATVPGGLELLTTMAAEEMGVKEPGGVKKLRMYNMGDGQAQGYAQGGLGQIMEQAQGKMGSQAQEVQAAGRGNDEILMHVSPDEYDAITSMWGEPDINPDTGMPEYGFLSKVWKKVKGVVKKIVKSPLFSMVAPIALNIFAPGLGSAIGGWLGATGQTAATIGNTILRTGIGAASGGKEGAISGALSGLTSSGVGSKLGESIGLSGEAARIGGDAILGGIAGEGTGVGFGAGALGQGMASLAGNPMEKMMAGISDKGQEFFGTTGTGILGKGIAPGDDMIGMMSPVEAQDPFGLQGLGNAPPPSGPMSPVPAGVPMDTVLGDIGGGNWWDPAVDWVKEHPYLTAGGALALTGMAGGETSNQDGPPASNLGPDWYDPLPNLSFDRERLPLQDYYSYGQGTSGEASFFTDPVFTDLDAPPGTGPLPGLGGPGGGGRGGRGGRRGRGGPRGRQQQQQQATVPGMPLTGTLPGLEPGGVGEVPAEAFAILDKGKLRKGHIWRMAQEAVLQKYYPELSYDDYYSGQYGAATGGYVDAAAYALGGLVRKYQSGGHVRGPGTGRSDDIPAVLSDGEFVIDSETVALLGDGSTDAGAKRLEEMRSNLRKHKSKNLAKGGFSHKAKSPEKYMAEGGGVKLKDTGKVSKSALKELKRLANRLEQAITSGNKKRISEVTDTLQSMHGGSDIVAGMAKGGTVKAVLRTMERQVEDPDVGSATGPRERRAKKRRAKARAGSGGRKSGRRLTDKEKAELAEELGGFTKDSAFIRRFKRELAKEKAGEK